MALLFFISGGAEGLPQSFANAIQQAPEVREALVQVYGISSQEEMLWIANAMLVSAFASWPLLLLGNMQLAQALLVRTKRNLRPQENYDRLQLPIWLVAPLAVFMGGAAFIKRLARKFERRFGRHDNGCIFFIGFGDYSCYFPPLEWAWLSARRALFPNFRDGLGDYPRQPNGIVGHPL